MKPHKLQYITAYFIDNSVFNYRIVLLLRAIFSMCIAIYQKLKVK